MKSDLPKVAHPVADRPMVWWVVEACRRAGVERLILVVGHRAEVVRSIFDPATDTDIEYVTQDEQLGTGHATLCAAPMLSDFEGDVLVLAGDGPLLRPETIEAMRGAQQAHDALATIATSRIEDPTGYGRVVRDASGRFEAIVEQKNATPEQLAINEIYPSYAVFRNPPLFEMLRSLEPNPVTGEYYVTELPAMVRARGAGVEIVDSVAPEDVLSINTPEQLAAVDGILRSRLEGADR